MQVSEFDFELAEELIAQSPLARRDASRMLVVDRQRRRFTDSQFSSIREYLQPTDVLVLNNTRVFPARLLGRRDPSGGRVEVLLVRQVEPMLWETLARPGNRLKPGTRLQFGDSRLRAEVVGRAGEGLRVLRFAGDGPIEEVLEEIGQTPLPPYIKRETGSTRADSERYQTVYARASGAIAAPTAGLHFSPGVLDEIRADGISVVEITLHVGYGTFEPVRVNRTEDHRVAAERFKISSAAADAINHAKEDGGRIVAVGTTTTRALESAVNDSGLIEPSCGLADLTITPGYDFRAVDALLTNFHLPRSSLLMLVCAFADREFILTAYRHAVAAGYRFYSYGDCMLIV
jgi:S-adenosylmethionine:tRNA ribosyltransferase-isomerase